MPMEPRRIRSLIESLHHTKTEFGPASAENRARAFRALRTARITSVATLISYHDLLLFLSAYPDNPAILSAARQELRAFHARVRFVRSKTSEEQQEPLLNSGLVETEVSHLFSFDLTKMLLDWYPGKLELDWVETDEDESGAISGFLPLVVSFHENDTLDNALELTTQEWIARARGKKISSDLGTLLKLLDKSGLPIPVQRYLYDDAGIVARWKVERSQASRTRAQAIHTKPFFQKEPILPRTPDLRKEIISPAPKLRLLPPKEGARYVRIINEALAVRYRELYPITGANPSEVYCAEPGRGVRIFVFGARPEFRLPLEANFGAMLVRNDTIIGYGVGACLLNRVEIAINVFPAFRTGESSFVIEQFFKLFHHHFGSDVLLVRSRQVGDGDDEPIMSGAFWFYYKLGFRPVKREIRAIAEKEAAYIAGHPGYRSSVAKLRRLSKSDVFQKISDRNATTYRELSLVDLGNAVTDLIASEFAGDREAAGRECLARVKRWLGVGSMAGWSGAQKQALAQMAPLLSTAPEIARWSLAERKSLAELIRAKGGNQERLFVVKSLEHPKFGPLLHRIAASAGKRS
jgi:hypothetical protein